MKKITRRTVLRASGLAAASLALSGCAPAVVVPGLGAAQDYLASVAEQAISRL